MRIYKSKRDIENELLRDVGKKLCTVCGKDVEVKNLCTQHHNERSPYVQKHLAWLYDHLRDIGLERHPNESKSAWYRRLWQFRKTRVVVGSITP